MSNLIKLHRFDSDILYFIRTEEGYKWTPDELDSVWINRASVSTVTVRPYNRQSEQAYFDTRMSPENPEHSSKPAAMYWMPTVIRLVDGTRIEVMESMESVVEFISQGQGTVNHGRAGGLQPRRGRLIRPWFENGHGGMERE